MKNKATFIGVCFFVAWSLSGCMGTTQMSGFDQPAPVAKLVTRPALAAEAVSAWPDALANTFDITETFDRLQPWRGRCVGNSYGKVSTPRHLDGTESIWSYYSCYGGSTTGPAWIDDFGAGMQITGKSLVIDMGSAAKGPSRLGLYFGDGRADSGYDDLYLFHRVRIPENEWPTAIDPVTKVGSYVAGNPFTYWASWKFGAFNMGCTGMYANTDCNGAEPYSQMHIVPHVKRYGYGAMAGKLAIVHEPTGLTPYWALGKEIQRERWLGVEFHYKLTQQDGQKAVIMETWLYDEDGTAHLAQAPVTHPYAALTTPAEKFNFFFLGGNNSSTYTWGPTMESAYHVDDFIINGTRIGPTYFQLANQILFSAADTVPPSVTAFAMPTLANSVVVPVSSFTASDNVGVTGYMITLSATAPLASASGWSATPPTSFSFPSYGTFTAYAWAKDAAGLVSPGRSAVLVVSRPDASPPVIQSFAMPSSWPSYTVPVTSFTATDDVGVTGYMITQSGTIPLATAPGWSGTAPTSYTFDMEGSRIAYAWVKDASGKISTWATARVLVGAAPVVTAFSMPSTATSLTVPVTAFTATDNDRVVAYKISETNVPPPTNIGDWSGTPPTSFTFSAGGGLRTAYAWARDWSGMVSVSRVATVTITLPPPVVTAFAMPATSSSLSVPVTSFIAGGAGGVGYSYLITETPTTPLANSMGWRGAPITSYNFSSLGTHVAYAWVKDHDGRISASRSASVTITLPDAAAPVVTAFAMPATATSLTVPVTTFTGSDDIGVTGYRITESATAPLASATGWLATRPASYTFSAAGARTAYAWVRDASGKVSASRSASVSITITVPLVSSWEGALKSNFDIVDTFDNLADWRSSLTRNVYGAENGPKKLDGSNSQWTFFSNWSTGGTTPWISNFGPGTSVTGKSLVIDIGTTNAGPSRMGMYFGNGSASSGYSDIYVFYRTKFPRNEWPTAIDANHVGSYTEGQPWPWWSSWKANTINMGCTGVNADTQCSGAPTYGNYHIVPHIKPTGSNPRRILYVMEPTGVGSGTASAIWTSGYEVAREVWSGVEFHYRNYVANGRLMTAMDVWLYESNGTAHQVLNGATFDYTGLAAATERWNFFFLGGNNSNSYLWGPTMSSKYYVDDFIIDGARIGPAYFQLASQLLGGGTTPSDSIAPTVTAFTMPATATSLTVPVTTFTATDNVAVTGYRITESATAPLASAAGWLATRPTSYTFSAAGARTAYAWARDAAGRVSASRSAAVTITVPVADTVAPVVTAFTMPVTATSLTVPVTLFTASDNVGVTGYRITESATAPLASATGWLAARPASYTFSAAGARTAYGWARDAAGRVSAARTAAVTITIPVADTIAPVVTAFSMPATAASLTVPVTGFAATDNVGVTGYMITESATPPLASAASWLAARPASYTFSAAGARTAYAWVRDAAGRVSAARTAAVTITIPVADTVAPVVTAFTMPAFATSLTVPVTSFTATDNIGVTGYRITESATAPLASATGWLAARPASYTFSAAGARTAYAWVRDAAGRVSASRSAPVAITISTNTANWESSLKSNFDIVETFDNLADWSSRQSRGNVYGAQYGPKKLDGSNSQWTYFSNWTSGGTTPWISNFGPGNSITGKSLVIDMGPSNAGPSRMGMYFGNGSASSGYSDVYVFYRTKFPRNEWPTSIDANGVGSYTEGQPWTYWYSWKANTINMGCTGVNANTQCSGAEPYGNYHIVPHVKTIGSSPRRLQYIMEPTGVGGGTASATWTSGYEVAREVWSGVEFHYRNYVSNGRLMTAMDVWLYDPNGTAHQVLSGAPFDYTGLAGATERWNFFFLGGNNSDSYQWGPTMTSKYYVDDFIIHSGRIGPRYFQLLNGY